MSGPVHEGLLLLTVTLTLLQTGQVAAPLPVVLPALGSLPTLTNIPALTLLGLNFGTTSTSGTSTTTTTTSTCPTYTPATAIIDAAKLADPANGWFVYKSTPNIAEANYKCINVGFTTALATTYQAVLSTAAVVAYDAANTFTGSFTDPGTTNRFTNTLLRQLIFGADTFGMTNFVITAADTTNAAAPAWLILRACTSYGFATGLLYKEYVYVLIKDKMPATITAADPAINTALGTITGLRVFDVNANCP